MTYLDQNQHCTAKSFIKELDIRVLKIYLIIWNFYFLHNVFFLLLLKKLLLKNEEKSKNIIG